MTREDFMVQIRRSEWKAVSRLQDRVIPILFGMGGVADVYQVDLRPATHDIVVWIFFQGVRGIVTFSAGPRDGMGTVWVDLLIGAPPGALPEAFAETVKRLDEEYDVSVVERYGDLWLRAALCSLESPEELSSVCQHLKGHVVELQKILAGDSGPFELSPPRATAKPASDSVRVVN